MKISLKRLTIYSILIQTFFSFPSYAEISHALAGANTNLENYREPVFSDLKNKLNSLDRRLSSAGNNDWQSYQNTIPDTFINFFSMNGVTVENIAFIDVSWAKNGVVKNDDFLDQLTCSQSSNYPEEGLKRRFDLRYNIFLSKFRSLEKYNQDRVRILFAVARSITKPDKLHIMSCEGGEANN